MVFALLAAADFDSETATLREAVDRALAERLEFSTGCPKRLADAIRYAVLAPGKRLRPLLVLFAAKACGDDSLSAMPAACAVEFIHAYSLVHDDLPAMDDDDLRRGQPTCHKAFDEATAILVGDALQARAFEILAKELSESDAAARCCAALASAAGASQLVGGQSDDLAGVSAGADLARLESIHHRKTGAMIRVSLQLGGIIASATEDQLSALDEFGKRYGLVFQITDDLLDFAGDESKVGKRLGKGCRRWKTHLSRPDGAGSKSPTRRTVNI